MHQRHPASILLAGLIVTAIVLPANAASTACDFRGYANDPDPAGANLRSGPGTTFPVLGVLQAIEDGGDVFAPEFEVLAFDKGWFEIGDASIGQYGDGPEQTVFKGPGWISAKLVGFEIQDPNLRNSASLKAEVTLKLEDDWSLDTIQILSVNGCDGAFLNVTIANPSGETATGWATDLCGNQATTCS